MDLAIWREYKSATNPTQKQKLGEQLVKENMPLIIKLVGQLSRRGKVGWKRGLDKARETPESPEMQTDLSAKRHEATETEDLLQAGCIGFIRALDGYNPDKGGIAAYAKHWIRHELQQTAIHDTTIYLPRGIGLPRQIYSKVEALRMKLGREPTAQEIGITQAQYDAWKTIPGVVGSLQDMAQATSRKKGSSNKSYGEPGTCGGSNESGEELDFESVTPDGNPNPEEAFAEAESKHVALEAMEAVLTDQERELVRMIVLEELPPSAAAKRLGLTVADALQLRDGALAKLREELDDGS